MPLCMIRAIVRPERIDDVLDSLLNAGFPAVTKMDVFGRGKQGGVKIGETFYDELPKELFFTVVEEKDKDFVVQTIVKAAKTAPGGAFGDGKIFVSPIEESWTVSSGTKGL